MSSDEVTPKNFGKMTESETLEYFYHRIITFGEWVLWTPTLKDDHLLLVLGSFHIKLTSEGEVYTTYWLYGCEQPYIKIGTVDMDAPFVVTLGNFLAIISKTRPVTVPTN
jgi:hypothetical protein